MYVPYNSPELRPYRALPLRGLLILNVWEKT